MKISARYQAVFEIIQEVFKDERPADYILNTYIRRRKFIGSKDRRFIVHAVWDIVRNRRRLEYVAGSREPRKILLVYLKDEDFDIIAGDIPYGLDALTKDEKQWLRNLQEKVYPAYVQCECPSWLYEKIGNPDLVKSLNQTAPADVRVNLANRTEVKNRLKNEGFFFSETPFSPYGLRSEERVNLNLCKSYHEGFIEVQDEASQLAALLCDVGADDKVIDYCAGAGGKSLAIAAYNRNEGIIQAHDVNWHRMDVIKARAERLGISSIKIIRALEDNDYDRFIVDAPCSGSGTWRRSPDAKYRLSAKKIEEFTATQSGILETAYKHTKVGGKIIYITCSVLPDENENVVEKFIQAHPDLVFADHEKLWLRKIGKPFLFEEKRFIAFSPLTTSTDGFFFCMIEKKNS